MGLKGNLNQERNCNGWKGLGKVMSDPDATPLPFSKAAKAASV